MPLLQRSVSTRAGRDVVSSVARGEQAANATTNPATSVNDNSFFITNPFVL